MTSPIYEWQGDYFCGGCIVYVITYQKPYSLWLEDGNTIENNETPTNLQLIREFLRTRGFLTNGMPKRLRKEIPEGDHFCAHCLNFFTTPNQQGTQ